MAALRETLALERGRTAVDPPGATAASQVISPTMDSVVGEGRDFVRGRASIAQRGYQQCGACLLLGGSAPSEPRCMRPRC